MSKKLNLLLSAAAFSFIGSCGAARDLQEFQPQSALPGQVYVEPGQVPSEAMLAQLLEAELQRLGKDPQRTPAAAPGNGGAVFDLRASLIDADEDDEAESVDLIWTYRNVGDYDQNGQVNVSDLTPLAQFWQRQALYDEPESHGGINFWPSGQPLADGGVGPTELPDPGSGAANWRIAAVDGDHNGIVNLSDITPIAVAFNAVADSYGIFRREQGTENYNQVGALQIGSPGPGRPLVLQYNDPLNVEDRGVLWEYVVRPLDSAASSQGPDSNAALAVFGNEPGFPLAEMTADPTDGLIPLPVHFSAITEAAPLGSIVNHEWDLDGDGSWELETGTGTEADFTYTASGVYIARLRATDDAGRTAIAGQVITVGTAPVARIEADPPGGEVPVSILLDGRSSFSEFSTIVKYEWDLDGDGEFDVDSGPVPEFTVSFDEPGQVSVGLRVTDAIGLKGQVSLPLELTDDYDEIEPNQSAELASPIGLLILDAAPLSVAGSVGSGGYSGDQSDWWSFEVPQGCQLDLTAEVTGLDPILRVRVVDVEGTLSIAEMSNLESIKQLSRGLKGAGVFYLQVLNEHTVTGLDYDYSLALQITELSLDESENNDSAAQADDLGSVTSGILPGIWGNLGPGGTDGDDEDWYAFTILDTDDYSFGMDFFHRDADLELALYDATGTVLFGVSETVTDRERIDLSLDPGEYRLRCYRNEGGNAFYQLSLFRTP
ncbi:MAG: PKD domain-containing protein [bacterium]